MRDTTASVEEQVDQVLRESGRVHARRRGKRGEFTRVIGSGHRRGAVVVHEAED